MPTSSPVQASSRVARGAPGSLVGRRVDNALGALVTDADDTVSELVARFQLRRRANTNTFRDGVRLARLGAVTGLQASDHELGAVVHDPDPEAVVIVVQDKSLVGRCSCPTGESGICRHQVAAAHALWVRDRGRRPNGRDD
jgi:uncharacterized Zn finger protein